jgi:hypothetical protein
MAVCVTAGVGAGASHAASNSAAAHIGRMFRSRIGTYRKFLLAQA